MSASPDRWLVLRAPGVPFSLRLDRRVPAVLLALASMTLALAATSLAAGEHPVGLLDALRIVVGMETGGADAFVVKGLRLPRTLVAVVAGIALGISGAILQGLTRNPLAAPGIVGITQGASLAAVIVLVAFPAAAGSAVLSVAAFAGAAVAAALVYLLAWKEGLSPGRLILVGIGVAAVAAALTTVVVTFGEIYRIQSALVWMVGSVHARGWGEVHGLLPWLLVFLPLALAGAGSLDNLSLGDEVATGLGSRVELERGLLLLVSVALAGSSVAAAGAVAFVGLMAPHLARRLVGPGHGGLLPAAALMGGLLVVAADLAGRLALAPLEIPCGIVTGIIGAPYFGYLLYRGGGT